MTTAECAMYLDCVAALLEAIVGALTPARVSGRSYLRTLLKEGGVLQLVPDACVGDLVEQAIKLARMARRANKASLKSEMVQTLDGTAVVITLWTRGGASPPCPQPGGAPDRLPRTPRARG